MGYDDVSRRQLLGQGAALATGLAWVPKTQASTAPAAKNDTVVIGVIGCGGMGAANMRNLMNFGDISVAALCDVDRNRIPGDFKTVEDKYGRKPAVYSDYREMLDRKDIDAVIVGTPDHWHALNLVHACEAGKDVFCEKPVSYDIVEAKAMVAAQKRFGRVVQVGTWQRSAKEFRNAIAYVRSGKLGRVTQVRAWISDNSRIGKGQKAAPPDHLDFPMWVGPAKMFDYQPNLVHWNWRWVMNTGGGLTTDWGVHMIDIGLLGMSPTNDLVMPAEVMTYGGQWAITDDDRDAPDTVEAILKFKNPDFVMQWSVVRNMAGRPGHCTEFVTAEGRTLRVWRGGWQILGSDGKEIPLEEPDAGRDHWREWVDCIKSRKAPEADLPSVAQTTMVCHLINASLYAGRPVKWDRKSMDIVGREGKETFAYRRDYRSPWKLPVYRS